MRLAKQTPVLDVSDLTVRFKTEAGPSDVVRHLSFQVGAGETLAVVGESGSGKSVTSLAIMRLIEHAGGQIVSGNLRFQPRIGEALDLARADDACARSAVPILR
jgi:glutathione transport system ATP-binding protein